MSTPALVFKLSTLGAPVEVAPRAFDFIASTEAVDADKDIILASAWDLTRFRSNPVILASHDSRSFPVASATRIAVEGGQLVGRLQFPEEGVSPDSDQAYALVKAGVLRSLSVGFLPGEWADLSNGGRRYTKLTLLEISLVSIGSNPDARVKATRRKAAAAEPVIGEPTPKMPTPRTVPGFVLYQRHIENGKWVRDSYIPSTPLHPGHAYAPALCEDGQVRNVQVCTVAHTAVKILPAAPAEKRYKVDPVELAAAVKAITPDVLKDAVRKEINRLRGRLDDPPLGDPAARR